MNSRDVTGRPRPPAHRPLPKRLARPVAAVLASGGLLAAALVGAGGAAAEPAARAVPATAATPALIPSLHNWAPGGGTLRLGARTRIDTDAAGEPTARHLADELRDALGRRVPVVRGAPGSGDIVLRTDGTRGDLGLQGYSLRIDDRVRITGRTATGVFYGTRTLLQLLAENAALPKGMTTDVPSSEERGVGVCACYTYNTEAWLTRLIKDMAYLKLNTLHLELKVKSSQYPAINTFSYYTPQEVRRIVATAARYHITVIPEINSPGHMDPYLTPYPDLQLTDTSGKPDPTRLDITDPDAFTFFTHLVDADLKLFPGPYFHMGADEYMLRSAYSNYPQLQAYARDKFGPDATPQDAYVDFVNRVDAYVRSKGRTLRIWNDGLTGENTVPLNRDIVVEHWLPEKETSQQLLDEGYRVMNATDALYYVRGSYKPDAKKLYDTDWSPVDFADGTVTGHLENLTGAEYNLWPDNYGKETENQTQQGMFPSLRVFAQAVWGGPKPAPDYASFSELADTLGHAPGYGPAWVQPLKAGTYRLRADGGALGESTSPATPGTPLTAHDSTAAPTWELRPTDDGYYRLVARDSGLCADVSRGAVNNMHVVEEAGAAATAEMCTSAPSQKWQLEPVSGGYRLVDAITQQTLVTGPDGSVVQQPRDVARHDVWNITPVPAHHGSDS
ncbi:family 20 glycosylhydrolase [Streptomyces mexicanus]|uniref:Family 20 glycosylhydrolase n=1 Tax=Streptomyces mexicanus TaxID=178566 RepID=A0A7X1I3B8_9ACTN|nr:family 20 glycosylhydrolase [Streptomyces mexicanus]MBC2866928.1 family 20 glycosylhydrolase [Streptomyces mexicanus]